MSMGFSRQEYGSGLPFPSPRDLPNLGIEPRSPAQQAYSLPFEPPGKPIDVVLSFFRFRCNKIYWEISSLFQISDLKGTFKIFTESTIDIDLHG